jgi:hypothetical protein
MAVEHDIELLSHLPDPEAWVVLRGEGFRDVLIEDDAVRSIYQWADQHYREHGQVATAAVLDEEFEIDFTEPETAIGDLIDRMRQRYMKNQGRDAVRAIGEQYKEDPSGVPKLLLQQGKELTDLLSRHGEMYGTGDVDRTLKGYLDKATKGPGPSLGFKTLDDYFYGQRGITVYAGPPKTWKALALDTPIPTSRGWITMESIEVGDQVFDEHGNQCSVTYVNEICIGRPCYRVVFSDGTSIVADAEHEWVTKTRKPEHRERAWTTEEIRNTLTRCDGGSNHSIAVAGPLQLEDADLPIDPYVLGAWLGDGTAADGAITIADDQIGSEIEKAGYVVRAWKSSQYVRGVLSLKAELRELGVLKNKRIPEQYLRASVSQRLSLLQGLMDTDGHCTAAKGECILYTSEPSLRDQYLDLIRSLGFKPMVNVYQTDCKPSWHISFMAYVDNSVFRLTRKRQRQRNRPGPNPRSSTRQITDIVSVSSVPVRCISVDSSSHLYLAGEGMIPTHNSWFMVKGVIENIFQGTYPWLYPLELPAEETNMRLLCMITNIPWHKYIHNTITRDEQKMMKEVAKDLDEMGVYKIVQPPQGERGPDELIGKAQDAGSGSIWVDQLQYVEVDGKSLGAWNETGKYWEVLDRSRNLTDNICFAHQFNRSVMNADKMPSVQQLKGSSAIEETATLALGLWASKEMRKSKRLEVGTLISRNHDFRSWEVEVDLTHRCNFDITGVVEDDE